MNEETVIETHGRPYVVGSNAPLYPEDEDCFESEEILESELLIDLSEEFDEF